MYLIGRYEVAGIAITCGLATVIAFLLGRFSSWSRRRVMLVSALPIPAILVALCLLVIVDASTASAEECGVDACGMAVAGAVVGLGLAIVAFVISFGCARLGYWLARR